jgi:hypothetical protein
MVADTRKNRVRLTRWPLFLRAPALPIPAASCYFLQAFGAWSPEDCGGETHLQTRCKIVTKKTGRVTLVMTHISSDTGHGHCSRSRNVS